MHNLGWRRGGRRPNSSSFAPGAFDQNGLGVGRDSAFVIAQLGEQDVDRDRADPAVVLIGPSDVAIGFVAIQKRETRVPRDPDTSGAQQLQHIGINRDDSVGAMGAIPQVKGSGGKLPLDERRDARGSGLRLLPNQEAGLPKLLAGLVLPGGDG